MAHNNIIYHRHYLVMAHNSIIYYRRLIVMAHNNIIYHRHSLVIAHKNIIYHRHYLVMAHNSIIYHRHSLVMAHISNISRIRASITTWIHMFSCSYCNLIHGLQMSFKNSTIYHNIKHLNTNTKTWLFDALTSTPSIICRQENVGLISDDHLIYRIHYTGNVEWEPYLSFVVRNDVVSKKT